VIRRKQITDLKRKRQELPQEMDSLDTEIFEALKRFEALPPCTESAVFTELARLDKQYASYPMYRSNVNGMLVNLGGDLRSITILSCAVKRLKKLVEDDPSERFYWQLGNACNGIGELKCGYPPDIEELVDSPDLLEARKWFSRVKTGQEFCTANTNAANILDTYSRNYEAILLYDRVLDRYPDFGMALGNKALALIYFFNISATGNPEVLLTAGHLLEKALQRPDTVEIGGQQSADDFRRTLAALEVFLKKNRVRPELQCRVALEDLPPQIRFFKQHEMFLNFCFKCSICEAGLKDNVFPALIERLTERKREESLAYGSFSRRVFYCLKILNHIFEDFSTARWMFFQAREQEKTLVELDDLTRYISLLDYTRNKSQFGLFKGVFSKLYGILDKVAYWVFFNYELQQEHIVFDHLLRPEIKELIVTKKNYQLLALYSLARDLMDGGLYNRLRRTRNHIIHRFLDLGEVWDESVIADDIAREQFLPLGEFESRIFQMFSLAKAAVFYFLNGVHADYRREKLDGSGIVPSIPLRLQKDFWKE
jgi:tetratricopeptide (TPR) repeat protein